MRYKWITLISIVVSSGIFANDVNRFISRQYPQKVNNLPAIQLDNTHYCFNIAGINYEDNNQSTAQKAYLLTMGRACSPLEQFPGLYTTPGQVGLFALKREGDQWHAIIKSPTNKTGYWGEPPSHFTFRSYGATYGYAFDINDTKVGEDITSYCTFVPYNGKAKVGCITYRWDKGNQKNKVILRFIKRPDNNGFYTLEYTLGDKKEIIHFDPKTGIYPDPGYLQQQMQPEKLTLPSSGK